MPKEPTVRQKTVRKLTSTKERHLRAQKVAEQDREMVDYRCKRCEDKKLRCFVDTASGRCAACISVNAECSLYVTEDEWEEIAQQKHDKKLAIARLEAQLAAEKVELLEVENRERKYARRDLAVLRVVEDKESEASSAAAPTPVA